MTSKTLPDGFAELEPFVDDWAIDSAFKRDAKRGSTSIEERQTFYDALSPRLAEVLDRLDQTPLDQHGRPERNLMLMLLSYAHVAQSIEVQGPAEDAHSRSRKRIPILTAPADR